MDGRSQRLFASLSLLAVLWVAVYWAWDPGDGTAKISFDARPPSDTEVAESLTLTELDPAGAVDPAGAGASNVDDELPAAMRGGAGQVEPPEFRDYVVRDDDTFERIARRELGDGSLWRAIARANPLRDPNRISAGDVIRLPLDPTNIQGIVATGGDEPEGEESGPEASHVEYIVQSGDVLGEIAKQYYGRASMAGFIFEHNRDVLTSMDDLRLGQTLRLPPASAEP